MVQPRPLEHFQLTKLSSVPIEQLPFSLPFGFLENTIQLSISMSLTYLDISYKWNYTVFVFLWLVLSLSKTSSRFIYVVIYNNFLLLKNRIVCMIVLFVHPTVGALACFLLLAIVNNAGCYGCTNISLRFYWLLFWIHIQKWNFWIIWQFYFLIFPKTMHMFP